MNQFTARETNAQFVQRLLLHRCADQWDAQHIFCCKVPHGVGVSTNTGGYRRVNRNGGKVVAHLIVMEVYQPVHRPDEEVSHLCGNAACCNPEHLIWETRANNISRRGCIGVVRVSDDLIVSACRHNPPCATSAAGVKIDHAI